MPIKIVATLIARNEARSIVRCIKSIRPWVDRVLLVDTGSTDATAALARQSGAEVHHLDWPDDFSAARNHALDLADADWHLILDADECIETGGEALRAWCQGPPRLGRICVHSAFDDADSPEGGVSTSSSWITRVIPRGARFEGRVHEQVVSDLPRERIEIHVSHDGYLDAQLANKRDRNRSLLLRDIAERPEDPYLAFQLGREAEGRDQLIEACDWYGKALTGTPPSANWSHDLTVRYLHCLGRAGRRDEALALAQEQMPVWGESPDFFFVVGNLALDQAMDDAEAALDHWLPLAVTCWERCLEIGDRPELEGSVRGRGSDMAQRNLDVVRSQMALLDR